MSEERDELIQRVLQSVRRVIISSASEEQYGPYGPYWTRRVDNSDFDALTNAIDDLDAFEEKS